MQFSESQRQEIDNLKAQAHITKRPISEGLEALLYEPVAVLDHGFVRVMDYMGNDTSVVQAARLSYGVGTKQVSQDKGLIYYLLRHAHTTPFEMCEIKFHVKLPIFIARQWIRHRTANVNEYSARYSILENEFYLPTRENLAVQSKQNRQGRDEVLDDVHAARVLQILKEDAERCYAHYEDMLNEDMQGHVIDENKPCLARELARMNLTLNHYTQWYWKIDLHNLLHFLRLRADPTAQYEIRVYGLAMLEMVRAWVPLCYQAFMEYKLNAVTLSATAKQVLQRMLNGEVVTQESSGLNVREWKEFTSHFEIPLAPSEKAA